MTNDQLPLNMKTISQIMEISVN